MRGALWYLATVSARNGMRARLRRLRQPRYVLALLLGAAYVWYFLMRPISPGPARASTAAAFGTSMQLVVTVLVTVLALSSWISSRGRLALAYSPAEIHFLFAGPISRRGLLGYKLLRLQLPLLVNALVWVFILGRGGASLPAIPRFVSAWTIFATLYLHRLGAALTRTSWEEHGRSALAKHRLTIVALVLFAAAIGWSVFPAVHAASGSFMGSLRAALHALDRFPASVALAPIRWLIEPSLAVSSGEWARALPPALAMLALHVAWVFRADVAFEEAAVSASAERVRLMEAMRERRTARTIRRGARAGRMPRTLPLASTGAASVAMLWKNVLALARATRPVGVLAILAAPFPIAIGLQIEHGGDARRFLGMMAVGATLSMLLLGARSIRNDLRLDMMQLALLKTLPIRGRTLVLAEIASSTIAVTAIQGVLLAAGYLLLLGDPLVPLGAMARLGAIAIAMPLLLLVNAANLAIQNGLALLLPAWVRIGPATGGVEVLGQGILLALGSMLLLGLMLLPPALLVFALMQRALTLGGAPAMIGLASAALLLLLAELWGIVAWLGRAFDRAEPLPAA